MNPLIYWRQVLLQDLQWCQGEMCQTNRDSQNAVNSAPNNQDPELGFANVAMESTEEIRPREPAHCFM